ncbi:MAG TPA: S41 family peptidase [Candidatus Saccharimonadales bacterium]|nr:S41 family peptidase [Candidatus Saccharimonadales bacterium]
MGKNLKRVVLHVAVPRNKTVYITRNLLILVAVFLVGLGIGDGKISFNSNHIGSLNNNLPNQLDYSSVNAVYQALKNNYDGKLTETELLNGIKHGLAEAPGDPYTEYFTASEARTFNDELNNTFSGIGAQLSQNSNGEVEIMSPISGSPAAKAGLQPHDIITSINGKSTTGMSADTAASSIRGKAGTKVTLGIIRGNTASTITITRANINLPSVNTKVLNGNIGYMQISTFADDTSSLTQKAASQFARDHVKGIILDLRDNPGGLVDAAIHVSSLWLQPGQMILQERRGSEVLDTENAIGGDVLHGLPTVVLINGGSASASEITAGALHDNKDAYIIGEKSFGKGVVQDIVCISGQTESNGSCPGDELKVTIASWYRPNGQNINHKGITPDQTVKLSQSDLSSGNDQQLNAAESYINSH